MTWIRNIVLIAIAACSTAASAQEIFKPDHLFSKAVAFGTESTQLVITRSGPRSPEDQGITATFTNKKDKTQNICELANPVEPSTVT